MTSSRRTAPAAAARKLPAARRPPSPVQARAEALGIGVRTPAVLPQGARGAIEAFAALEADVAVVAAYGLILPQCRCSMRRGWGASTSMASLLPRWRGAAPIQRAILAGDAETGVGIMQMEAGLDTGPVRLEGRTPMDGKTAGELTDRAERDGRAADGRRCWPIWMRTPRCRSPRRASPMPARSTRPRRGFDFCPQGRAPKGGRPAGARIQPGGGAYQSTAVSRFACIDGLPRPTPWRYAGNVVLDEPLTIACDIGAIRPDQRPARRPRRPDVRRVAARLPDPRGNAALTRFALTVGI